MNFVFNRELTYDTDLYDVILVGTNLVWETYGAFQQKMFFKFPELEKLNRVGGYDDLRRMGIRKTLKGNPTISLLYYFRRVIPRVPSTNYTALEKCLKTANAEFKGKKVATLIIGSTKFDGNGNKKKCLRLLRECMTDVDLYVYDYDIPSITQEYNARFDFLKSLRTINPELYNKLSKDQTMLMEMWEKKNELLQKQQNINYVKIE